VPPIEPLTTYSFLAGIAGLNAPSWDTAERDAAATVERLEGWDSAWSLVLALGLEHEAEPAIAAAREAGASPRLQALAGAACAAVAARGQLGERRFRALYRPFAQVLPADPEELARGGVHDLLLALCPAAKGW
jgi:hypothetical protein